MSNITSKCRNAICLLFFYFNCTSYLMRRYIYDLSLSVALVLLPPHKFMYLLCFYYAEILMVWHWDPPPPPQKNITYIPGFVKVSELKLKVGYTDTYHLHHTYCAHHTWYTCRAHYAHHTQRTWWIQKHISSP
jgi:hypothetical protein